MNFNEDFLGEAARRVKKAHLDDGVPPTEEITKIADEHDLTIEQIKRVCEESNKAIKLATKTTDPQYEFVVADPAIVIEDINRKMASTKTASMDNLDELSGYGGTRGDDLLSSVGPSILSTKTASAAQSLNGASRAVYHGIKSAIGKIDREMGEKRAQADKVAGDILDMLYAEGKNNRSINRSYSSLMKSATTEHARNRIFAIYKFAQKFINTKGITPLLVTDLNLEKTASAISVANPLFVSMNKYITLRAQQDKLAAKRSIYEDRMPRAFKEAFIKE